MSAHKTMSDYDRLFTKIDFDVKSGCWDWNGPLDKDGYPRRWRVGSYTDGSRRAVRVQRWAYETFRGPILDGLVTDHLCRNRRCVHPLHLEVVTPLENHRRGLRQMRKVCSQGHEISGTNELQRAGGHRCRICFNAYQNEYRKRNDYKYQKAYVSRQKERGRRER